MSDLILLAALLDGPKHGWALKKLAGFLSASGDMHNNLVYPLMKKFVAQGWVRRRSEPGQRGQTRAVYSLTLRGNQELLRRLEQFGEKEATSASQFRVRVSLFALLDSQTRHAVLARRESWLVSRQKHFVALQDSLTAMKAAGWALEVVAFLLQEVRHERRWINMLSRKSAGAASFKKLQRR
jgi:DNA-binding PadR family transcriptional regulator